MYQIDDIGSTHLSLPPNLQEVENECLGYAFDRQTEKMHRLAKQMTVWGDPDNADPKYYDYMAMMLRAPYYKSEYEDAQKLAIIKTALLKRRYAGTTMAIEELLKNTISAAEFMPWYEYGGRPYHFKIVTDEIPESDIKALFTVLLKQVKAARSVFEFIEVHCEPIEAVLNKHVTVDHIRIALKFPFYGSGKMVYLDGTYKLDGSFRLDGSLKRKLYPVTDKHGLYAQTKEIITPEPVIVKRNWWKLDGSVKLDGSRKLNAKMWKEEL